MNHQEIDDDQWIERYVMAQLDAEQLERFEEHFLGCSRCLEQLELGERFHRALRTVASKEMGRATATRQLGLLAALARISHWQRTGLLTAFLVLVCAPSFWALRLDTTRRQLDRQLAEALAPSAGPLLVPLGLERSDTDEPSIQLTLRDESELLLFSLDPDLLPSARAWDAELTHPNGEGIWSARGLAPSANGDLLIGVPSGFLERGVYRLKISTGAETTAQPTTFSFRILR